jgi:holo-[acyl-carrier protein] synthase
MIVAIGIDAVEVSRMEGVLSRRGERFRARVFTEAEVSYCESHAPSAAGYAARFAAKEAVMKALGTGWAGGVEFRDIEVVRDENNPPSIRLRGKALEKFKALGAHTIHLSITHTRNLALAQVVLES